MDVEAMTRAAETIAASRLEGGRLDDLPTEYRPATMAEAYLVQGAVNARLIPTLGPVVGHKIGCTTTVMQEFLGIDQPCAGEMFESRLWRGDVEVPASICVRAGVECEIAVRLGQPLRAADGPFDEAAVAAAVDAVMASIELVDDRYLDYPGLDTPTLVADDFFNAGCVVGTPVTAWRDLDLAAVEGTLWIDGAPVGTGKGSDILGHPLKALHWLANHRAGTGRDLGAGTVATLGSLVRTHWIGAGQTVRIELTGLGGATLRLL